MGYKMSGWSPFTNKKERDLKKYGHKSKGSKKEPYGPEQSHSVRPGPTASGSSLMMSPAEQQQIQRTISKQGHFGDIPPSLLKGYERGTPEFRRRVGEINAHHHYLVYGDSIDMRDGPGSAKNNLVQSLAEMQPENWSKRQSRFRGPGVDLYNEDGSYKYQAYEDMLSGKNKKKAPSGPVNHWENLGTNV